MIREKRKKGCPYHEVTVTAETNLHRFGKILITVTYTSDLTLKIWILFWLSLLGHHRSPASDMLQEVAISWFRFLAHIEHR